MRPGVRIAAIDYLLKAVTEERFDLGSKRAISRLRDEPHEDATKQLMAMLDAREELNLLESAAGLQIGEESTAPVHPAPNPLVPRNEG